MSGRPQLCPTVERLVLVREVSGRERDVLALLAAGADDNTIASKLYVSHRTVRSHISSLFMKLQVHNRTEVALTGMLAHLYGCESCRRQLAARGAVSPGSHLRVGD